MSIYHKDKWGVTKKVSRIFIKDRYNGILRDVFSKNQNVNGVMKETFRTHYFPDDGDGGQYLFYNGDIADGVSIAEKGSLGLRQNRTDIDVYVKNGLFLDGVISESDRNTYHYYSSQAGAANIGTNNNVTLTIPNPTNKKIKSILIEGDIRFHVEYDVQTTAHTKVGGLAFKKVTAVSQFGNTVTIENVPTDSGSLSKMNVSGMFTEANVNNDTSGIIFGHYITASGKAPSKSGYNSPVIYTSSISHPVNVESLNLTTQIPIYGFFVTSQSSYYTNCSKWWVYPDSYVKIKKLKVFF